MSPLQGRPSPRGRRIQPLGANLYLVKLGRFGVAENNDAFDMVTLDRPHCVYAAKDLLQTSNNARLQDCKDNRCKLGT